MEDKDVCLKITPAGHQVVPGAFKPKPVTPASPFSGGQGLARLIAHVDYLHDEVAKLPIPMRVAFVKEACRRVEIDVALQT